MNPLNFCIYPDFFAMCDLIPHRGCNPSFLTGISGRTVATPFGFSRASGPANISSSSDSARMSFGDYGIAGFYTWTGGREDAGTWNHLIR